MKVMMLVHAAALKKANPTKRLRYSVRHSVCSAVAMVVRRFDGAVEFRDAKSISAPASSRRKIQQKLKHFDEDLTASMKDHRMTTSN